MEYILEPVPHRTSQRPYSVHDITAVKEDAAALYAHWHKEMELFYLKEGELNFYIEDQLYPLKEGEGLLIPSGLFHRADFADCAVCRFQAFVFSPRELIIPYAEHMDHRYISYLDKIISAKPKKLSSNIDWEQRVLLLLTQLFSRAVSATAYLSDAYKPKPSFQGSQELAILGLFLQLWQELYDYYFQTLYITTDLQKIQQRLQPVFDFIEKEYPNRITIDQLANTCHLSVGQFTRLFKTLTQTTPFIYLNRFRIMKSCLYLVESNEKISTIAELSGFRNLSYYNREFQKLLAMSPSKYRIQNRP